MRYILIFCVLLLHTLSSFSQDKFTLQQCVAYALKNNVSVKLSDVQSRLSALTARQSEMTRLPNLNGNINSAYQHGLTTNPTTNILESSSYISGSMNVQASYNIFNWSARKNTIAANNLYKQADEVAIDRARNDVSLAVANAFLQVMLRREQAKISELQMGQSRAQVRNTMKLVTAGSVPELNVIQLEAQYAKDSSGMLQAQALILQALINLKAYMNYDFAQPLDIVAPPLDAIPLESISDLQPEAVFNIALNTQPLQQVYKLRIAASQKQAVAARSYMYPNLSAFGGMTTSAINVRRPVIGLLPDQPTTSYVNVSGSKFPVFAPSYGITGYNGIPIFNQFNNNFGQNIGLSLNFSIFNAYTSRTQWERAKVNVTQLQLQKEQESVTLKANIYNAYQDAFSSLQKYNASRRTVEYSQKAFDISKKRYDIGLLGTLDFIITQNNLYFAQIDEVTSHYDYIFKMKVLEFYKGQGIKL